MFCSKCEYNHDMIIKTLFFYKNTLCKNTEAQITQKLRTI